VLFALRGGGRHRASGGVRERSERNCPRPICLVQVA
jgi:hypothetical protein